MWALGRNTLKEGTSILSILFMPASWTCTLSLQSMEQVRGAMLVVIWTVCDIGCFTGPVMHERKHFYFFRAKASHCPRAWSSIVALHCPAVTLCHDGHFATSRHIFTLVPHTCSYALQQQRHYERRRKSRRRLSSGSVVSYRHCLSLLLHHVRFTSRSPRSAAAPLPNH